jgi:hypothetical protein
LTNRIAAQPEFAASQRLSRFVALLSVIVVLLAAVSFMSWALIATAHADDMYPIPTVNGIWLALVSETEQGVFYRPQYDGDSFGGTRYMPVPILVYAGAAKVTGELVVGPKLVVYAVAVLLLGLLFIELRRVGCPLPVALGLTATVVASWVGSLAMTGVQGDALPVLLQLGALVVVTRRPGRSATAAAALLCALALLAKFSALWAPAAILVWLLARDRRRALTFAGSFVLFLAAGIGVTEAISHGHFSDNFLALSGSSFTGLRGVLLDSPDKLTTLMYLNALPTVVMFPFVLVSLAAAASERKITVYHLSFVFAFVILLVVLADPGTDRNHLLDITVLSVVLIGYIWLPLSDTVSFRAVLLAALVWALALGNYTHLKPQVSETLQLLRGRGDYKEVYATEPPPGIFRPSDRILSQDPYVPVAVEQRPVVLDAFALLQLLKKHPDWQRDLIARINNHEFDKIVLYRDLTDVGWWAQIDFGTPVIQAIDKNYRIERRLRWRDLSILVPKSSAGHDWPIGSVIYRGGDEPNLRVVDHLEGDGDPEMFACLVVEPVS